jgi:hypothetical protein
MSTLTYSPRAFAGAAAEAAKPARSPLWRRLFDGFVAVQQRRAEREIARYLATRGGILTDDAEREIMRSLSGTAGR